VELTIQALGAIGEFLGSIGVIATLIYVGVQVRQNTRAVRSSTMQSVSQVTSDVFKNNCEDLERTEQFAELASKPSHSVAERLFYIGFAMQAFRAQENAYYQRQLGAIDPASVSLEKRVRAVVTNPTYRRVWDEGLAQAYLSDEYIAFIEQVLSDDDLNRFDYKKRYGDA
jgi:hypothetical protein